MEHLPIEQYRELCSQAKILQQDRFGPKVLRLGDGQMVKIFRRKRLLSSALIRPYARRFQRNAARLAARGITTVTVTRLCRCPALARHLVFYQPVPGITLRDFLALKPANCSMLGDFAAFLAHLHALGIYFRSIHFGNVIVLANGDGFGLIDIADLRVRSAALPFRMQLRNFRHFLRYREDRKRLDSFGAGRFVGIFAGKAGLSVEQARLLEGRIAEALAADE